MTSTWEDMRAPSTPATAITAAQVVQGPVVPPQQQLLLYSPDQWEDFVQEWAHYCLKDTYKQVQRFSGAGDMGIDIVGFADDKRLMGVWDNYQCKHYDHPLTPGNVWAEFGKILWYSYTKQYSPPRRYYFVAPKGAGTSLSRLLGDSTKLRDELVANWDKNVKAAITMDLTRFHGQFELLH